MDRKEVVYDKILSWNEKYQTRLNYEFVVSEGDIERYMIQLEFNTAVYIDTEWVQVARFDTSHSFMHMDLHYNDGTKKKYRDFPQTLDTKKELLYAEDYLRTREEYLLEVTGYV